MSKELNEWIGTIRELVNVKMSSRDTIKAVKEILLNIFEDNLISKEEFIRLTREIERY